MATSRKKKAPRASARQVGGGAVAQGKGAVAAGKKGVAVGGDVHGDVVIHREGSVLPEEAALHAAYLERLIQQAGFLSLSGIDPAAANDKDARLRLESVYTALLTRSPLERSGRKRQPDFDQQEPVPALAQLNEYPKLVLLGDPGSGKSTFLNFVAVCLAGQILGKKDLNLRLLTAPLPEDEESIPRLSIRREKKPGPQPWKHGALLPVRVVLRDFAAVGLPKPGVKGVARHLWDFITKDLTDAGHTEYIPLLKKQLVERGGLLLLDGLDEVPEPQRRRQQIREIVEAFVQSFSRCRVLLTSRTYAYQNQEWRLPGFSEAVLAPFSGGQIRRFVALWYSHQVSVGRFQKDDASGRAAVLERAIFGSDRLRELAERPLLLTLMASLHAWRGGTLPDKRELLYHEAVELLLNLWERQRVVLDGKGNPLVTEPSLAEWLRVDREKVRKVLDELAFEAHASQPELAGTADVPEERLVLRLLRLSRDPATQANTAELMKYLCNRAGLLVPRGVEVYTFPHRTFQEYLAACHLTGETFPDQLAELVRADPNRWREVALLAGAKAARGTAASIWYLADALCSTDPQEAPADPAEVWGAHLAGQAVAEVADLAQISRANLKKLERLRAWHVRLLGEEGLPATERALAGRTLARLGDPRFDPELWYLPRGALLGFVQVPAGPFQIGSVKEADSDAFGDELPQHEVVLPAYYIARYPVTVQQFGAFLRASSYEPADRQCLEGHSNHSVVNVTWHDALAYCGWLGERLCEMAKVRLGDAGLGVDLRRFWEGLAQGRLTTTLPSEAEWEKAARGTDGRIYPWGNTADSDRANYDETKILQPSAAGCFPRGASPFECEDMSGNVWEWTRSLQADYPYPADEIGRQKLEDLSASGLRVFRGGAFYVNSRLVRCAYRSRVGPADRSRNLGFRVALFPFSSGL